MRFLVPLLLIALLPALATAAGGLDLYVIDVEGGNAKLVVSPSGESMLVDAGWPGFDGRDTDRIVAAAKAAGLKQIDYFVLSHLDIDHVGDLALLASKIPIGHVIDNGPLQTLNRGFEKRYEAYAAVRDKMPHSTVSPGDKIPIKGLDVQVVSAARKTIGKPAEGAGAANPACASMPQPEERASDREDNMSIGLLYTFGRFRMLDLADLEGYYSYQLACPNNLIGKVDVYSPSVHGQFKGSSPALERAIGARVVIMNNGAKKGGDAETWPVLRAAPGLEDIWQSHFSLAGGKEKNPPDDFIANLEPVDCQGKWIKLSAASDGVFTVTNSRNGFSKTYRPAPSSINLANDKIDFTASLNGGTLARIVLASDPAKLSPLAAMGHFLCLDGFGPQSREEAAAGMPFHGEASKQLWKVTAEETIGRVRSFTISSALPLAQENISRTMAIVDGENVVYVASELESLVAFDRPVSWAEHATLGPPFLEPGKLVVDMPATQCRVRAEKPHDLPNRLIFLRDFTWPMGPTVGGGQVDLRGVPAQKVLDMTGCLMDPKQTLGFVTALNLDKHLLFGYVWPRQDYPWVMSWMNYTGDNRAARGMEFSTQPFDLSHLEVIEASPMFGTPTFRWLPAKSKLRSRFLVFYTQAPDGFTKVDSITLTGGVLTIEDRAAAKRITLAVSRPL